jgi:hypothetical protein
VFAFTIATNGYDDIYQDYLLSHSRYAAHYNYKYIAFTKAPPKGISGSTSAWLKVALILEGLKKGYQSVFFIDADALIHEGTPPIESLYIPNKYIYMSTESTGNYNSGVIIIRNHKQTINFFSNLLLRADIPNLLLPKSDRGLYENGHVINMAKKSDIVQTIDPRWNYNYLTHLPDGVKEFILHGRGTWLRKPRSQHKTLNYLEALTLRFQQGLSRYLVLKELVRFYKQEYSF